MNDGISVADALALRNTAGGNGLDAFGGNGAWWIIVILLFAFGGWGRGFGNGGNDGGATVVGYSPCCTPATSQSISDAFNFNQLDNGIRSIANGICDGFYAQNNAINNVLSAIQNCCCQTQYNIAQNANGITTAIAGLGAQVQQGFCGVDKSILQQNYQNQAGFNDITNQIANGICSLTRGQENLKYAMATNTSTIINEANKNTDRIINYLTQNEMDKLRTELQAAQFQLSQLSQTSNIVNQLMPVAKPAYLTCSPFASAYGLVNNNCACACA